MAAQNSDIDKDQENTTDNDYENDSGDIPFSQKPISDDDENNGTPKKGVGVKVMHI